MRTKTKTKIFRDLLACNLPTLIALFRVIVSNSDWFLGPFESVGISRTNCFSLGSRTLNYKALERTNIENFKKNCLDENALSQLERSGRKRGWNWKLMFVNFVILGF